jgi:hypothetical protein
MDRKTQVTITLRASEWYDINQYITVCHNHVCINCRDQDMHDVLHSLQSELIAAGQEVEFNLQAGKDGNIK